MTTPPAVSQLLGNSPDYALECMDENGAIGHIYPKDMSLFDAKNFYRNQAQYQLQIKDGLTPQRARAAVKEHIDNISSTSATGDHEISRYIHAGMICHRANWEAHMVKKNINQSPCAELFTHLPQENAVKTKKEKSGIQTLTNIINAVAAFLFKGKNNPNAVQGALPESYDLAAIAGSHGAAITALQPRATEQTHIRQPVAGQGQSFTQNEHLRRSGQVSHNTEAFFKKLKTTLKNGVRSLLNQSDLRSCNTCADFNNALNNNNICNKDGVTVKAATFTIENLESRQVSESNAIETIPAKRISDTAEVLRKAQNPCVGEGIKGTGSFSAVKSTNDNLLLVPKREHKNFAEFLDNATQQEQEDFVKVVQYCQENGIVLRFSLGKTIAVDQMHGHTDKMWEGATTHVNLTKLQNALSSACRQPQAARSA